LGENTTSPKVRWCIGKNIANSDEGDFSHPEYALLYVLHQRYRSLIMFRYFLCLQVALYAITCSAPAAAAAAAAAAGSEPRKITMALISTTTAEETRKNWQPLLDDFAKSMGQPVDAIVSTNYSEIVAALREGRAQVAWMGNKPALEAVEGDKAQIFAQFIKLDGSLGYKSLLIVPQGSPIKSLDDMLKQKGSLSFLNGDPKSTSGYLVPGYYVFARNKITPESQFAKVANGNHQKNFLAVAKGEVDVATNNSEDMERFKKDHPEEFKKVKVVWSSTLIPNDPMLYRTDLPEAQKAKIERFFLNYGKNDARQLKALNEIHGLSGFKKSNNAQLIPIADLELFNLLRRNQDDEKKSPAEKQKVFEEITARFGKLGAVLTLDRTRNGQ
jgi:phosphonate transport system substrate-binding protein